LGVLFKQKLELFTEILEEVSLIVHQKILLLLGVDQHPQMLKLTILDEKIVPKFLKSLENCFVQC
jgi:hypothetical protein